MPGAENGVAVPLPPPFRVALLFTGTRDVPARVREEVTETIAGAIMRIRESRPVLVVVGDCPTGVDAIVRTLIENAEVGDMNVRLEIFSANWDLYGASAGPRRNRAMATRVADSGAETKLCLALPGPRSKGTWDCVRAATSMGIPTQVQPVGAK